MELTRGRLISINSNCWRSAKCRGVRLRGGIAVVLLLVAWLLIYLLVYLPRGMVG